MGLDLTGLGSIADFAGELVKRFFPAAMTDAEKAQAQIAMQAVLQQRESAIIDTQKNIIVAEMQQSDNFTKRARPTIVYAGLSFIFFVHVFLPLLAFITKNPMPSLTLPNEFWVTWGGVCSIWVIGRSAEKYGITNKITGMITGNS
ncbi:conserved hypothetical protein [uncultured Desulfobacterium sp.]|uniref:Holin of 3TMs, for gene-transfer release n=1 Tax=uncultured Desulfobacterium sp. TaxID=201089 RepID=A0A445MWM2_9BACT|nr:conserved hypothetical protein [uncultured Desulfobacterium sp.]